MRLIDADKVGENMVDGWQKILIKAEVNETPTIDPESLPIVKDLKKRILNSKPIENAKWIFDGDWWEFRCSNCRNSIGNIKKYQYCPYCGAKMDGGTEDE